MAISEDNNSLTSKIVVNRHVKRESQSNRAIGSRGIAETLEMPHATPENLETIDNRTQVVERDESIMTLTAEAVRAHLANLAGRLSANGAADLNLVNAVPSRLMIEKRVPVATAPQTLDVTVVTPETLQHQFLKIKHQALRLPRKSLL